MGDDYIKFGSPLYYRSISSTEDELSELKRELELLKNRALVADRNHEAKRNRLPERYIINTNATIIFWKDGDKTIVKRTKDDDFNARLGFLTAYFQKHSGMSRTQANKYLSNLKVED